MKIFKIIFILLNLTILSCNNKTPAVEDSYKEENKTSAIEKIHSMIDEEREPLPKKHIKRENKKTSSVFFSQFSPTKSTIDTIIVNNNLTRIINLTLTDTGDTCKRQEDLILQFDNVLHVRSKHGRYVNTYKGGEEKGTYNKGAKIGWWYKSNEQSLDSLFYNFKEEPSEYYTTYHEDGSLKTKGKIINGKKHGIWKQFHRNCELAKIVSFKNGMCDSIVNSYNYDGVMTKRVEYKSNKRNGIVEKYDHKGRITFKGNNINGKIAGKTYKYDYYNETCTIQNIINDKKEGLEIIMALDKNNQTKLTDTLKICPYINDFLHGKCYIFKNNMRTYSTEYHMGLRIGMQTFESYDGIRNDYYALARDKEGKLISVVEKRIYYYKDSTNIRLTHIRIPEVGIEVTFYDRNGKINRQYVTEF